MKRTILGLMVALGTLSAIPAAQAQGYGYGGYAETRPDWGWQRHEEWRQRREFWRQRREMDERRAYEAGQRDAYARQRGWGYR